MKFSKSKYEYYLKDCIFVSFFWFLTPLCLSLWQNIKTQIKMLPTCSDIIISYSFASSLFSEWYIFINHNELKLQNTPQKENRSFFCPMYTDRKVNGIHSRYINKHRNSNGSISYGHIHAFFGRCSLGRDD
jgi:hypothetical protein